jgi:putative flavoprotein involved in K+ transport
MLRDAALLKTSVRTKYEIEDVVVVGGGHSGLGVSHYLMQAGIKHRVLEKSRIGESWRSQRWDSFRFNTPNGVTNVPGASYDGLDPEGFMSSGAFIGLLEAFCDRYRLPVERGVAVTGLVRDPEHDAYRLTTPRGIIVARQVVIASGSQNRPIVPGVASSLPAAILQLHAAAYRSPSALPHGAVLVVGSGSSGSQIAEDLVRAGRTVYLSTSRITAPPRRYRGRDVLFWIRDTGRLAERLDSLTDLSTVSARQPVLSGVDGGHTLTLAYLDRLGVVLLGRLDAVDGGRLLFADTARDNIAFEAVEMARFRANIDAYIARNNLTCPPPPEYDLSDDIVRPAAETIRELGPAAAGITVVIWCTGFGGDYRWINVPMFDEMGRPKHRLGVTGHRGLYIIGLPWLSSRKSALVAGVDEDARYIAARIQERLSEDEGKRRAANV